MLSRQFKSLRSDDCIIERQKTIQVSEECVVTHAYEDINNACQIKVYWKPKELLILAYCGVEYSIMMEIHCHSLGRTTN